jgi:hypothetical protein
VAFVKGNGSCEDMTVLIECWSELVRIGIEYVAFTVLCF